MTRLNPILEEIEYALMNMRGEARKEYIFSCVRSAFLLGAQDILDLHKIEKATYDQFARQSEEDSEAKYRENGLIAEQDELSSND